MGNSTVMKIQKALLEKGFLPGIIDGIWGRRTIAAVKAFQSANGLVADGIVGVRTSRKLFGDEAALPPGAVLPWMAEAENLMGTREVAGTGSNRVILDWADNLDLHYPGDDVPWCGLFVGHCVASSLPEEVLPPNPLGARQWGAFGEPTQPRRGAVLVFWRESKNSGKGHVGFYTAESATAYRILGGNQSNQVSLAWIGKDRFLKARWPVSAASLGGGEAIVLVNREQELEEQLA
jgi:uncharacterized protein (TIGR02594 family)